MTTSVAALALVILMSFAGGWVWRGVFDLWRQPQAKVYGTTNVVWGTTVTTGSAGVVVTQPVEPPPRLRAVE